jgi:hypothetical protein
LKRRAENNPKYSKRKYMLTRTDVLKKTILRALRKEYDFYFFQFLKTNNISLQYNIHEFESHLQNYAEYIKGFNDQEKLKEDFGSLENLHFVIGLFIDF